MIYYILLLLALFVLYFYKNKNLSYIFIIILFFVGAFRNITIGTDTQWYYYNWFFTNFNISSWNRYTPFEPGFNLYIAFFKSCISNSYNVFYSSIFIITHVFTLIYLKKFRLNIGLFFALYYVMSLYAASLNIMRQFLALHLCTLIMFYIFFKKKNVILYETLIIVTAIFLHKSMMMLCLLPLFNNKKIPTLLSTRNLYIMLVISVVFSVIGGTILEKNLNMFMGVFGNRADQYISSFMEYGLGEREIGYFGQTIYATLLIFISRNKRNIFFYFGIIGFFLSIITSSFLPVIGRLTTNMTFFFIIYFIQNWEYFIKDNINKYILITIVLYYCYSLYFTLLNNETYNPYSIYL